MISRIYCLAEEFSISVDARKRINKTASLRDFLFSLPKCLFMLFILRSPTITFLIASFIIITIDEIKAETLEVGQGYPFASLTEAANVVLPGDTILIHSGIYNGGIYQENLQGTANDWVYIFAASGETVIFSGGGNAWQFSDAAYLHIEGFIFEQQTGNGVNFDDGGSYDTPTHHIVFESCTFRDINATGNNDLLKLSGLDSFEIRSCTFLRGAAGGSGIDMVGCHDGIITQCRFEDLGSNSIQAKGGCRNIRIERNVFNHGGSRALNLGGSTGLPFFRPLNAPYEAAELKVYSNVFIGSDAPVAFVGTINTEVVNNTFYLPTKWVLRILQETVDPDRFPPCGNNTFRNNIIYIDNRVSVECNIGPNTAPETFTFSNNLWFQRENSNWAGPDLPASDPNSLVGADPLLVDPAAEQFSLQPGSPAIGLGMSVPQPTSDFDGHPFLVPRSSGAYEGGMMTSIPDPLSDKNIDAFTVYPNPASDNISFRFATPLAKDAHMSITSISGIRALKTQTLRAGTDLFSFNTHLIEPGMYVIRIIGYAPERVIILH